MYIHKEGKNYVRIAILLFALLASLTIYFLNGFPIICGILVLALLLLTIWVFWFFRIPARDAFSGDDLIMSPCDGKVVVIEETFEPEYFKDQRIQVSIFMSPLNVHVNRYPISGSVEYVKYHKGKYLVAWHPKSSTENERSTVVLKNNELEILVRQIAGAVARRIVTYSEAQTSIKQNGELGFIKFGSRVDVFLPLNTKVEVEIGDKVLGLTSIIAKTK